MVRNNGVDCRGTVVGDTKLYRFRSDKLLRRNLSNIVNKVPKV